MIDTESERLLLLTDAAKVIPGRPSVPTLWRWRMRGVRGVRLETCVVGGRRYTSREALSRFIVGTTAAADGIAASTQTSRQRMSAIEAAERELGKAGI